MKQTKKILPLFTDCYWTETVTMKISENLLEIVYSKWYRFAYLWSWRKKYRKIVGSSSFDLADVDDQFWDNIHAPSLKKY